MLRSRLRALLLLTVVTICTIGGGWAALRIAGPSTATTVVGDVQIEAGPGSRAHHGVELYVPLADWGLRARVTKAPLLVSLEPRRIDRSGLVDVVSERGTDTVPALRRQLERAVRRAVRRAVVLSVLGALAGGVLAALVWRVLEVRPRGLLLAPIGALLLAVVLGGGVAAWAAATWDAERLERPEYYASGAELDRLLDQAGRLRSTGARYRDRVDLSIRSIAGLLDEAPGALGTATAGRRRLVLASDVHSNLLTLPTLRRYGAGGPVVLAGDFTINGSRLEGRLVRGLSTLGRPVVAVSGNHDSPGLMEQLRRRGVRVLTRQGELDAAGRPAGPAVSEIAGLRMVGFEDPLAYAGRGFPRGIRTALSFGDLPDGRARYEAAVAERWRWWQALPERPQVLVVHQEAIGRALGALIRDADPAGAPLAILVGHTHRQRLDRMGPVTVVNSGSVGAGGVFGAGRDALGIARLEFDASGALEATDLVEMNPSTTAARARRVITERPDCDGELVVCAVAPEGD